MCRYAKDVILRTSCGLVAKHFPAHPVGAPARDVVGLGACILEAPLS